MAPLIDVRNLSVRFPGSPARGARGCNVSFDIAKGETGGAGRRVGLGQDGFRALHPALCFQPARSIPSGEILFEGEDLLRAKESEMRRVRGNRISIIFQEPMTSLNPLHTVEKQVSEVLIIHRGMSDRRGAGPHARAARQGWHPRCRSSGFPPIRTSFRAASASA